MCGAKGNVHYWILPSCALAATPLSHSPAAYKQTHEYHSNGSSGYAGKHTSLLSLSMLETTAASNGCPRKSIYNTVQISERTQEFANNARGSRSRTTLKVAASTQREDMIMQKSA